MRATSTDVIALDPISSDVVEQLIASFRGRYTVVVVTHNLNQAGRIADYAAFFWITNGTGRLAEHGSSDQIFRFPQDALTEAYPGLFKPDAQAKRYEEIASLALQA